MSFVTDIFNINKENSKIFKILNKLRTMMN